METHSSDEASRSLDTIQAVRRDVAGRLACPRWYYPVLGALVAQLVLVSGLTHGWVGYGATMLSALLVAVVSGRLFRHYAGRTGLVGRFPRAAARSRAVMCLYALGVLVPVFVVAVVDELAISVVIALSLVSFASTVVLGPAYDAAYGADLQREGAA